MNLFKVISLAAFFALCSCVPGASTERTGDGGNNTLVYETELALPEGQWEGMGLTRYSDGTETEFHALITVKDNVLTTDFHSGDYSGVSVDKFRYTAPRKVLWLDPNDQQIGSCECIKQTCTCQAKTGDLTLKRTLVFSKMGLGIHDEGTIGSQSYRQHSQLSRRKN